MENTDILPSVQAETAPQIKIVKAEEVEGVLTQLLEALNAANTTIVQCRAFIQLNLDNLKSEPPTQEESSNV
jgi:hypothetical protein